MGLISGDVLLTTVTLVGFPQLLLGASTTYFTLGYFQMGFLCSLLVSPGAQLLSLLFRLSKVSVGTLLPAPRKCPPCPYIFSEQSPFSSAEIQWGFQSRATSAPERRADRSMSGYAYSQKSLGGIFFIFQCIATGKQDIFNTTDTFWPIHWRNISCYFTLAFCSLCEKLVILRNYPSPHQDSNDINHLCNFILS